jgi:two-component system phosphate regulon response regulator PhoB
MKKKVMVIDDEPFILMMIEDKLSSAGLEVITSKKSVGAVDIVLKERPDLIILDWMLPEISGLEVCRSIMANSEISSIPIIMLSAKGQVEDMDRGLMSGVRKYMTKPFSPKTLLKVVLEELGVATAEK